MSAILKQDGDLRLERRGFDPFPVYVIVNMGDQAVAHFTVLDLAEQKYDEMVARRASP